jgi:tetratricopeptide (TPR) repeat protein
MPRRRPSAANVPQTEETWAVGQARLRAWVEPEDEPPYRPFLLLIADLDHGTVVYSDMFEQPPGPGEYAQTLHQAFRKPMPLAGRPRRPRRVGVPDPALLEPLAAEFGSLGLTFEVGQLEGLAEIITELEAHMSGGPENPGLLSVAGVTPALVGDLFAAAAACYRARPWEQLEDRHALALRIPAGGQDERIVSVLGFAGIQLGLAVYRRWADLEKLLLGVEDPAEAMPADGGLALWFEEITNVPFDDLDAIAAHGWEVAEPAAHPIPAMMFPDGSIQRPGPDDLRWLTAALRAIPQLVQDHFQPAGRGEFEPFEAEVAVTAAGKALRVHARFPAGTVDPAARDPHRRPWEGGLDEDEGDDDNDDLPFFDRRMMESQMAQLIAGMPGAEPLLADPRLRQAQELMYQAWDEQNPARRLSLAHQALAASPDCADAYVLLAEEEADTLARAEALYRQGVEAGERALGADYFVENKGHFWGLLETRPYMRAREGLAGALWQLERLPEAAEHYRALLDLNPGDNQGIRSQLLDLLLTLDDYAGALDLLKRYRDDGMAEWLYTGALVLFQRAGRLDKAERRLRKALAQNEYVPAYLTGRKRVPGRLPPYLGFGDDAEAQHYAARYLHHWRRTPRAIEWLQAVLQRKA